MNSNLLGEGGQWERSEPSAFKSNDLSEIIVLKRLRERSSFSCLMRSCELFYDYNLGEERL